MTSRRLSQIQHCYVDKVEFNNADLDFVTRVYQDI